MHTYLVEWETSGIMPIQAESPEQAQKLAAANWPKEVRDYCHDEIDIRKIIKIETLEQAYRLDPTIREVGGDCEVVNSKKTLAKLLPSEPTSREQDLCDAYLKATYTHLLDNKQNALMIRLEKNLSMPSEEWRRKIICHDRDMKYTGKRLNWDSVPELKEAIQNYFDPTPVLPFFAGDCDDCA